MFLVSNHFEIKVNSAVVMWQTEATKQSKTCWVKESMRWIPRSCVTFLSITQDLTRTGNSLDPIFVDFFWFVRHSVKPNIYEFASIRQFWPRVRHMSPSSPGFLMPHSERPTKKRIMKFWGWPKVFVHATQNHGHSLVVTVPKYVVRAKRARKFTRGACT